MLRQNNNVFFFVVVVFLSYSKRVCGSVHTECCEQRKLYNGGCDDNGGPTSDLPNEVLGKIIDFALTGTDISIVTYNSLCQLGEPFKELTIRYICRLPRISYNHRDTARNGCLALRKLSKEFVPYSGFVLALREIIASPRWINAWVELLFAEVGTWFYATNVWWKEGRGSN